MTHWFNIGIGNNDVHLKNRSFIYRDGRTPALAPAYDYVCTKAYLGHNHTALPAGNARFCPLVTMEPFDHLARRARVSRGWWSAQRKAWSTECITPGATFARRFRFEGVRTTIVEQFERVPLSDPRNAMAPAADLPAEPRDEVS